MKTYNLTIICMALLLSAMSVPTSAQVVSNDNEDEVYKVDKHFAKDFVPGQVLVKMKDGNPATVRRVKGRFQSAGISKLDKVLSQFGVEDMEQLLPNAKVGRTPRRAKAYSGATIVERDLTQLYKLTLAEEKAPQTLQLVDELKTLDEVEFAEPNYKMYLMDTEIAGFFDANPFVTQQWYLDAYGVKQLWNKPIVNPTRPIIAIIDTGVDMTHPDLAPNLWINTAEANGEEGYDNDGNGFKNDVHGWDFINNTGNIRDNNMHGTHVAGIAAAANNGIGIVGANPQALIMAISVMQSDGTGDVATIVRGIDYAVANGATVLNLSLGSYANSRALRQSLERAYQKAVIVAAAGNDFARIHAIPDCHPGLCACDVMFPAGYSFVIGVQATTQSGALAGFSNHDLDGPNYSSTSTLQDPEGFNYELSAPGVNMLSTIPGGSYKVLNGTSMASPLVAGAISALKMVKEYDSQEILWGDLLHTSNIAEAYAVTNRPAELDFLKLQFRDRKELGEETEEDYSDDGRVDAGETISIYPVIRTTFGEASNIKMHLEMGDEFEDPSTVEIITNVNNKVDFGWHLDAYGKAVSVNPLKLKVADDVANGRYIKLKIVATCDGGNTMGSLFTIVVDNISKIGGLLSQNITLTADKEWLVSSSLAIPSGVTVSIEPGTNIYFSSGTSISNLGNFIANGTPEKPIMMKSVSGIPSWYGLDGVTLKYCKLSGLITRNMESPNVKYENCELNDYDCVYMGRYNLVRSNLISSNSRYGWLDGSKMTQSNIVNCTSQDMGLAIDYFPYDLASSNNWVNSFTERKYLFGLNSSQPVVIKLESMPYYGTSSESILRPQIYEIENDNNTFAWYDLTNMKKVPNAEAHGIVWKVCVNGKDAQDEYEDLAPLGVGKHKFEVYFNRPMNKVVAPSISFGVREPYTQQAVVEDGSWNDEGTIYTAYKTITGKTKSDGICRIYVYGAEDNEYFEIPYEKTRFNIQVQAAGSMATGFMAEAGLGRVNLSWNNDNNDFDDAMGFNIYRYGESYEKTLPAGWYDGTYYDERTIMVADTVRINQEIVDIETTKYTDYDVTPGETYHYMYKVLSTDLKEYDVSNVVVATPLTATLGDANGSGDVDVADVITTVNYAAGMDPKPFIYEAADMNVDQNIDILDVIGIIKKILNPEAGVRASVEATATYTIEDGTLCVESPVALAGVQVQLALNEELRVKNEEFATAEDLNGFEHTSVWLSDNDYLFLAYNLNGKTLSPGKHALLHIGDAKIADIRFSDTNGHNVIAIGDDATKVNRIVESLTVKGIYDLKGRKLTGDSGKEDKLPRGVYIINGKKVIK